MRSVNHWTEQLFLEHGALFLRVMKRKDGRAPKEVEVLERIFSETKVHPGDRVLDLCCGYGRHALRLAEKGFIITGVDISPVAIKHAKELAENMKIQDRIEFLMGDAREILKLLKGKQGSFRAIINMWTSIGYYDDETDKKILRQLNRLASPGGILVIELGNRDFIVKHFQPFGIGELEGCELHEQRKLNLERSRVENTWKFYKKEGEELKHLASIPLNSRLYSLHELVDLLGKTGWKYINSYGNLELQPVTPDTRRIIIVGKKD